MLTLILSLILNGIALYVTCSFVPGLHIPSGTTGFIDAVIGAVILAIVNAIIRPILLILTLPINILTLGLFTFVILGLTFWLMTAFAPGIRSDGLLPSIIGALVFGFLNWMLHVILQPKSS